MLSWGKPRIFIKSLDEEAAKWIELPTPVENSTQLTPTKGDKKEAKVEGGDNEDVKYTKNNYELALQIRSAKGRKKPMVDDDGVISGHWAVMLQPEDPAAPGFSIDKATASMEDSFTSEDGGLWDYTFDALKPDTGKKVKWGTVTVGSDGTPTFTEDTTSE